MFYLCPHNVQMLEVVGKLVKVFVTSAIQVALRVGHQKIPTVVHSEIVAVVEDVVVVPAQPASTLDKILGRKAVLIGKVVESTTTRLDSLYAKVAETF
jgi:hypothetical protein